MDIKKGQKWLVRRYAEDMFPVPNINDILLIGDSPSNLIWRFTNLQTGIEGSTTYMSLNYSSDLIAEII
jgi:hypothetical protein